MKIDVEGFEAHVVAGALKMFTQSPPLVVTMEYFADMIDNAGGQLVRSKGMQMTHALYHDQCSGV